MEMVASDAWFSKAEGRGTVWVRKGQDVPVEVAKQGPARWPKWSQGLFFGHMNHIGTGLGRVGVWIPCDFKQRPEDVIQHFLHRQEGDLRMEAL